MYDSSSPRIMISNFVSSIPPSELQSILLQNNVILWRKIAIMVDIWQMQVLSICIPVHRELMEVGFGNEDSWLEVLHLQSQKCPAGM